MTPSSPNLTLLSQNTCLLGIKVFPSLSGGIKTSGGQHQQIGGDCRTSPLSKTDWGDWGALFCVLHIGRYRVFGAPEESLGTIGPHTNPSPHLTRASAFHSHAREAPGSGGSPSKSLDSGELLSQR